MAPEGDRKGFFYSLLSAALLLLAQPPFQFILLPFLALTPLAVALGQPSRRPAWYGLLFGLFYWGVLLLWVPLEVGPRFSWAFPGYMAQVGLLSGLSALMAWCAHRLRAVKGLPLYLAFPLAWVGMEWLKAHFSFGLAFPWLGLGMTLTAWPEFLGLAEWTGEAGVAFWLALVNGLLAMAFLDGSREREFEGEMGEFPGPQGPARRLRWISLAALVGVGPAFLGLLRARTLPTHPGPRVAVVGTGVPASLRLKPVEGTQEALREAREMLQTLPAGAVDLAVLPEAVVGLPLEDEGARIFRRELAGVARSLRAPLLFGALGGSGGDPRLLPTNSAFLMDSLGILRGRYDKVRLVPGMEWGGYRAGEPGQVLEVDGMRLGPLICYESIFGSLARMYGQSGAVLLVNLTSDVWFGGPEAWPGRGFLAQHPSHLVMRAVETRTGVARAANGGLSLLLDPLGKALTEPLPPGPGMALATVPVVQGSTLFSRTGDLVGPACVIFLLVLLLPRPWSRRGAPGRPKVP